MEHLNSFIDELIKLSFDSGDTYFSPKEKKFKTNITWTRRGHGFLNSYAGKKDLKYHYSQNDADSGQDILVDSKPTPTSISGSGNENFIKNLGSYDKNKGSFGSLSYTEDSKNIDDQTLREMAETQYKNKKHRNFLGMAIKPEKGKKLIDSMDREKLLKKYFSK